LKKKNAKKGGGKKGLAAASSKFFSKSLQGTDVRPGKEKGGKKAQFGVRGRKKGNAEEKRMTSVLLVSEKRRSMRWTQSWRGGEENGGVKIRRKGRQSSIYRQRFVRIFWR